MARFTCLDCGNRSSNSFPGGKCPACGSFKIKNHRTLLTKENPKTKTKKEILLLVLLWGFIGFEGIRRYLL